MHINGINSYWTFTKLFRDYYRYKEPLNGQFRRIVVISDKWLAHLYRFTEYLSSKNIFFWLRNRTFAQSSITGFLENRTFAQCSITGFWGNRTFAQCYITGFLENRTFAQCSITGFLWNRTFAQCYITGFWGNRTFEEQLVLKKTKRSQKIKRFQNA